MQTSNYLAIKLRFLMKHFIYICVLFSFTAQASENAVESIAKLPKSPCSFSGDFSQSKTVAGLDTNLESTGSFYYHCEDGVIWSTRSPINETLILSREGINTKVIDQNVSPLKGRQSKLLGKLLNSMMSGNQVEIEQQFELNPITDSTSQFELLPKKKSLKRAIKKIVLTFSDVDSGDLDTDLQKITIQIKDRKKQLTSIISSQTNVFDSNNTPVELRHTQCLNSNITPIACDQLYPPAK